MAEFAEVDKNNIVLRVVVISDEQESRGQDFLANDLKLGSIWVQTDINGKIRKNYAAIGYSYDKSRDAFITPEPKGNIGFDEEACKWIMPKIKSKL